MKSPTLATVLLVCALCLAVSPAYASTLMRPKPAQNDGHMASPATRQDSACVPLGRTISFGGGEGGFFDDIEGFVQSSPVRRPGLAQFETIKSVSLATSNTFGGIVTGIKLVTTNKTVEHGQLNTGTPLTTLTFLDQESTTRIEVCVGASGPPQSTIAVTYLAFLTTNRRFFAAGVKDSSSNCHLINFADDQLTFVGVHGFGGNLINNLGFVYFDPAKCGLFPPTVPV